MTGRVRDIAARQFAVWLTVTFLYFAFTLTIWQGIAIGWALLLMTRRLEA